MASPQLITLPCVCGCGRPAGTLLVRDLPDEFDGIVRAGFAAGRMLAPPETRRNFPKLPDGANPLSVVPPDVLAAALGIVHADCAELLLAAATVEHST